MFRTFAAGCPLPVTRGRRGTPTSPSRGSGRARRARAGVTLVELLVATVIASLVLLAAYASSEYFFTQLERGKGALSFQQKADYAALKVDRALVEGGWAYRDEATEPSIVVEQPSAGTSDRIRVDGSSLRIGSETIVDSVAEARFDVFAGRVAYMLRLQEEDRSQRIEGEKTLRNTQYRALWHFTEDGPIAYDDSPNNNNAAVVGAERVDGSDDTWLRFDGAGDRLRVPDNKNLDPDTSDPREDVRMAFAARVRSSSLTEPRTLIHRGSIASSDPYYRFWIEDGRMKYAFVTSTVRVARSPELNWQGDRWYTVLVQQDDPRRTVRFYRDGKKVGAMEYSSPTQVVQDGDLYIGATAGSTAFWDGELNEVKMVTFP